MTAMILPSNDGFVGINSWPIPTQAGTYTLRLNAYDAGTEVNDELRANMPAPPFITLGNNGTGVTTLNPNTMVHIHSGNLGDFDPAGGVSDMDAGLHRWLNPVASVTVTIL